MENQIQTHVAASQNDDASELEEEEHEVMEMAEKVVEYRNTLPDELKSTLASLLAAQRPILPTPFEDHSDVVRPTESANEASLAGEDQEDAKKLQLLKQKISSNASAIPVVLKRMKECMARMDKLQSYNGVIHPAFKRKRPN